MARKNNRSLAQDVRPVEVWSWAMYDFANSGYTTVVITTIFNTYFVAVVAGNAPWATLAWTLALAAANLLVMLTAPAVGAFADARAAKKRVLAFSTAGCVLGTVALATAGPGSVPWAVVLIVAASFFFGTGENVIAAFLPELARGKALGRVSGWGWSLGYLGGLVALGACLAYIGWAEARGQTAVHFVPVTMLITAAFFAVASLPTFLWLRERAQPRQGASVAGAFSRLARTFRQLRHHPDLRRFLLCLVFYSAGIQAVIALAAIYAQQAMGFGTRETVVLVLVVNVTAAIGAFVFGHVQDRIGHKQTVALTLAGWLVMVWLAWGAEGTGRFWLAANLAGLCLGASQSAGRALVGLLAPPPRRAEFFGVWGVVTKASAILGPVTYGLVTWLSGGDHRLALLITGSYFVAGLAILARVDVVRGRRAALRRGRAEARERLA